MSIGKGKQGLVFSNRTGGMLDYQTMRPFLIKWLRACQLPQVGFHGFRHSHASLLLNADVPYKFSFFEKLNLYEIEVPTLYKFFLITHTAFNQCFLCIKN